MAKYKISMTSDKHERIEIQANLRANDGYCPCRIARTPDTKCMCKEFRESEQEGPCHCGLYIKTKVEE